MHYFYFRAGALLLLMFSLSACSSMSWNPFSKDEQPAEDEPRALVEVQQPRYSFDKEWSESVDRMTGKFAELLTPVWADDSVFIADEEGTVQALDIETGKRRWRTRIKANVSAGLGTDIYQIYLVTAGAELVALDKKDGSEAWRVQLQSAVLAPPVSNNLVVVTHSVDGKVSGFDPHSGNSLWVHQETTPEFSIRGNSPGTFVDDQWVVLGLDNGKVVGLRTQQGTLLWEKRINQQILRAGNAVITDIDLPIIYTGSNLLISTQSGEMLSVDKASGQLAWQGNYDESIKYYAVNNNLITVVTQSDKVFTHDLATGELAWVNDELRNRKLGQPALDDQYIYLVDFDGILHMLALDSGKIIAHDDMGLKRTRNAVHLVGDNIYAIDDSGKLVRIRKLSQDPGS